MDRHLLMAVHLHADGMGTARFHGIHADEPEWPPAPARLFQALVAGAARGSSLPETCAPTLRWLECLPPPTILTPPRTLGQPVSLYVPNNDADSLPDPSDVSSIRIAKQVAPSLFDGTRPLLYAWPLPDGEPPIASLCTLAHELYQLGRGLDMAWADVSVLTTDEFRSMIRRHIGLVFAPTPHGSDRPVLSCPVPGSLDSLITRHLTPRLRIDPSGKAGRTLFTNPPKPSFAAISYAPHRRAKLYELRERGSTRLWPWPLHRSVALVETLRDAAFARLRQSLPEAAESIERCLLGRWPDGSGSVPVAQRIRIVPLPSIGTIHVDRAIRRILVEVPATCPLAFEDLDWAFSGLDRTDPETGEASAWVVTRAEGLDMQAHYCQPSRHWQSVTAVALPDVGMRSRGASMAASIGSPEPNDRITEERRAVLAVQQALRHADVPAIAVNVKAQHEPYAARGKRAEAFAEGTRFAQARLWHVAITFDRAVSGPLCIGDGRFVGLGVLAPTTAASGFQADPASWTGEQSVGVLAFDLVGQLADSFNEPVVLARAFRRAVMSRVGAVSESNGRRPIDSFFSGHSAETDEPDSGTERHVSYQWDAPRRRLLLLAPHRLQRRNTFPRERFQLALLDRALEDLSELRAGHSGRFELRRRALSSEDPLLAAANVWESVTPYVVTRHRRLGSVAQAIAADVESECRRCGLPEPTVTILEHVVATGQPLRALLRLAFPAAVFGPLALGRTSLLGGGLFANVEDRA